MKIANYEYYEKIGQGAFGTIYKGKNLRTGENVVLKMESMQTDLSNASTFSVLKHETNILNVLYSKNCRNIPPTYWYGITEFGEDVNHVRSNLQMRRVLVMPFYEESLETIFVKNGKMASNVITSAISIMEHIHDKYVIHRDIKPSNFMIHNDELILIDFGLATFYVDSNEKHISPSPTKKTNIIGTPKYASLNIHCGEEYSRRDDLMSIVYIGLFLMYGIDLWKYSPNPYAHSSLRDCPEAKQREKDYTPTCSLTHPINQWFKNQKELANVLNMSSQWYGLTSFANDVYGLSFKERPSYKKYIDLFKMI
jgi:serine/threonine protein kinase